MARAGTNSLGAQGEMISPYAPRISSWFSVRNLCDPCASVTQLDSYFLERKSNWPPSEITLRIPLPLK